VAGELVAGAVDGLNLYVYVGNNPLKYTDPTGHGINTISNDEFFKRMNKDKTSELNIWFLLGLGFVFACDNGSATIGVIMFVTEGLGIVVQL
jgi:hypothetical protein